jgi:branched-chain amino acid transport system permease protein
MTELTRLIIAGMMAGSVYALVGLSFSFVYKGTNLINWAQGDWFMIGAFIGFTTLGVLDLPFWVAIVAAAVILFVLGFVVYRTLVHWMVGRGAQLLDVLLATIGLSILLQNVAMLIWGTSVRRVPPLLDGTLSAGEVIVPRQYLIIFGVSIVAVTGLYFFMQRTDFGTAMRAAADNAYAARVVGIPEHLVNATTWGIGAAIAGVAGVMVAPIFGAYFFLGLTVGIKGFAAAVVGGFGRPYGALAGGLLLGVIETLAASYISSAWKDGFAMAVLILFLLLKPHGLFRAEAFD